MTNPTPYLYKRCYKTGFRYCARCGVFRCGLKDRPDLCEDCHTRLRVRAKGGPARREREPEIRRL